LKNFDEAKKNYEYAIKSDSLNSEAFNNLGVLYLDKNDIDNAWKYLRKAVMLDKNYFDALNNYATVLIAKKNFTEAKKYLIKAMTLNRKSAKPFINFGLLFYEQNNNNKAEEYLLMALEKEPENKDALSFLNFIRNPESRLNSDKEGKINSQEMKLFEKGVKLMSSGNFPEAEKIFILVTENNTKFANAFEKLAIAQTNLKKYDDALRAFSKALEIEPNSPVMLKNMAVVYQKTGKIDKVIECYQKAARLGDIPAQEWLNLNGIKW